MSDFAESLPEQALQGAGMAWLPRALVAADLKAGSLVLAGLSAEPIRYEIRLYRSRHTSKPQLQKIWAAACNLIDVLTHHTMRITPCVLRIATTGSGSYTFHH